MTHTDMWNRSGCCGKDHKHFVINSESLEGVCVRHTDDCTPLCVPYGEDHPDKRRVCTSGCNRVFKKRRSVVKRDAATEGSMFDMVACQAEKRVVCEPRASVNASAFCSTEKVPLTCVGFICFVTP